MSTLRWMLAAALLLGVNAATGCKAPPESAHRDVVPSAPGATSTPVARVRILFTGDVIPARCVYARQQAEGDYAFAFREIAPVLNGADLVVGSLDASLSDAGKPIGCTPTFNLLAPPRTVEGLAYAGFDVMTLASNHIKDCGGRGTTACDEALLDTLANLHAAGIATTGAGADTDEAKNPAVVEVGGTRFSFLGYDDIAGYYSAGEGTPGSAPLDSTTLADDIRRAARGADVVVVLPHWGVEYTVDPTERQRELAKIALDAGATLIAGNHPHTIQATEDHGDRYVAYSLGNFVFDQDWSVETQESMLLAATFEGKRLVDIELVPVRIGRDYQPARASAEEAAEILERVRAASDALR